MVKKFDVYEILYLVDTSFTDDKLENKIEYYRNFAIENGSSTIVKNCGQKELSYSLKKQTSANYIQMVYLGNGELVNLLNKELSRDESILRTILTRLPKKIAQLK